VGILLVYLIESLRPAKVYLKALRFKDAVRLALRTMILSNSLLPKSFARALLFRASRILLEPGKKLDDVDEVSICRFKEGADGGLCVSIDYESFPEVLRPVRVKRGLTERISEAAVEVLRSSEKYSVPMTWGVLGVLALEDPSTFERMVMSGVKQDVGSHSFSHVIFNSPECSVAVARVEVSKGVEALKGIDHVASFIFPNNKVNYLNVLREYGFVAYRGDMVGKLAYPSKTEGLWDIHKTYYLYEESLCEVGFVLRLMDLAVAYGCVLHLFFHPWNVSLDGSPRKFAEKVLEPILGYATERQNEKKLWICTMRELANYCEARENCRIENIEKTRDRIGFTVSCKISDSRFDFPPGVTVKVRIPSDGKIVSVLDGGKQLGQGSWRVAEGFVFLALSFEKDMKEIRVLLES
jgi:hypothetical protein